MSHIKPNKLLGLALLFLKSFRGGENSPVRTREGPAGLLYFLAQQVLSLLLLANLTL